MIRNEYLVKFNSRSNRDIINSFIKENIDIEDLNSDELNNIIHNISYTNKKNFTIKSSLIDRALLYKLFRINSKAIVFDYFKDDSDNNYKNIYNYLYINYSKKQTEYLLRNIVNFAIDNNRYGIINNIYYKISYDEYKRLNRIESLKVTPHLFSLALKNEDEKLMLHTINNNNTFYHISVHIKDSVKNNRYEFLKKVFDAYRCDMVIDEIIKNVKNIEVLEYFINEAIKYRLKIYRLLDTNLDLAFKYRSYIVNGASTIIINRFSRLKIDKLLQFIEEYKHLIKNSFVINSFKNRNYDESSIIYKKFNINVTDSQIMNLDNTYLFSNHSKSMHRYTLDSYKNPNIIRFMICNQYDLRKVKFINKYLFMDDIIKHGRCELLTEAEIVRHLVDLI